MVCRYFSRAKAAALAIAVYAASAHTVIADPGGTAPPPTSPNTAIDHGTYGYVPPRQTLFRSSYDSGKLFVGRPVFPRLWYKFDTGAGEARILQFRHWAAATEASYKLFDASVQFAGNFDEPNLILRRAETTLSIAVVHDGTLPDLVNALRMHLSADQRMS